MKPITFRNSETGELRGYSYSEAGFFIEGAFYLVYKGDMRLLARFLVVMLCPLLAAFAWGGGGSYSYYGYGSGGLLLDFVAGAVILCFHVVFLVRLPVLLLKGLFAAGFSPEDASAWGELRSLGVLSERQYSSYARAYSGRNGVVTLTRRQGRGHAADYSMAGSVPADSDGHRRPIPKSTVTTPCPEIGGLEGRLVSEMRARGWVRGQDYSMTAPGEIWVDVSNVGDGGLASVLDACGVYGGWVASKLEAPGQDAGEHSTKVGGLAVFWKVGASGLEGVRLVVDERA